MDSRLNWGLVAAFYLNMNIIANLTKRCWVILKILPISEILKWSILATIFLVSLLPKV